MGNKPDKSKASEEITERRIAMLMENTIYSEKEVRAWYAGLLCSIPKGKLKTKKLLEIYKQFCEQGQADASCSFEATNERTMLILGDVFPDLHLKSTIGEIQLHQWIANSWCLFFSHPADFTPVCTTELSRAAKLAPDFAQRNVKCLALSCDSIENHHEWIKDLEEYGRLYETADDRCQPVRFPFPIIEDTNRVIAKQLGMIDPEQFDSNGLPLTARAVFIIAPDKKLKASVLYPATTGRNFDEILRLIDGLQLSARLPVATPVNWQVGEKVMVPPDIREDDIKKHLPQGLEVQDGLPSGKIYIRFVQV